MSPKVTSALLFLAALLLPSLAGAGDAMAPKAYTTTAAYADVRQEIEDGIVNAGLSVEYVGHIDEMLSRTGADVGSTRDVYKHAEYLLLCSARLSRAAMEADAANLAVCPYVIYLYETVAKPGEVVAGYRRPIGAAGEASQSALAEIDRLLDEIVRTAVE